MIFQIIDDSISNYKYKNLQQMMYISVYTHIYTIVCVRTCMSHLTQWTTRRILNVYGCNKAQITYFNKISKYIVAFVKPYLPIKNNKEIIYTYIIYLLFIIYLSLNFYITQLGCFACNHCSYLGNALYSNTCYTPT